jgi:small subunit ribosomal protein S4e
MTHLKRHKMPRNWPLSRKEEKFVTKPDPGPHPLGRSLPLKIILREVLGHADTSKEARSILNAGKVLVDKKPRKEPRFPVGLMDVIEIPDMKKHFRVDVSSKGITLRETGVAESASKTVKIVGKTTIRGGQTQLNLHDGRNIILKKDMYSVGDSLKISLPDQKILSHLRFQKDSPALIISGRNVGERGKIKDAHPKKNMLEKSTVTITTSSGRDIQTLKDYILVGEFKAKVKA